MPARVQAIPSTTRPGVCFLCARERTCCADVVFRGEKRPCVLCAGCRIAREGHWQPVEAILPGADLPDDESRARRQGRGLRARSPSKHSLPFTF